MPLYNFLDTHIEGPTVFLSSKPASHAVSGNCKKTIVITVISILILV